MVVAIIGILATLIIVSLQSAGGKARDAKRKNNARNVASALAQYHQDNSLTFPIQNPAGGGGVDVSTISGVLSPTYLTTANVFTHDKNARYISDGGGLSYGQAWELENTTEAAVATGNGVFTTNSANAQGVVATPAKGGAVSFNGSTTTVTINEPAAGTNLHPATNQFSVSFWINPGSVTGNHALAHKCTAACNVANAGWRIWLNGANVNADYELIAGTATNTTNLVAGTWYHVVVDYIASGITIYVNGTSTSSTASLFTNTANVNPIVLGGAPGGSGWTPFLGTFDGFHIFNRVLSTPEVNYIYNSGNGSYGSNNMIANAAPPTGPLLAGLRFDEGTGTALASYATATTTCSSTACTLANGSWSTGNSPLGLFPIGGNILGRAYVTYGPQ